MSSTRYATRTKGDKKTKSRSRDFFITINKDIEVAVAFAKKLDYRYLAISCVELAPETGHEHVHIYVYFDNHRNLSKMIKLFNKYGDVEVAISTKASMEYIQKSGGLMFEDGEIPCQGKRTDISEALESCNNISEFKIRYPDLFIRYHNGIRDYYGTKAQEEILDQVIDDIWNHKLDNGANMVKCYYITGAPGSGKTYASYILAKDFGFKKNEIGVVAFDKSGFCKGTRINSPCLIWNEFRDTQIKIDELLQLCDQYGYAFNVKGGKIVARPKVIIFNSSRSLDSLYRFENEDLGQIYRRIYKYYRMKDNYEKDDLQGELDGLREEWHVKMPEVN